jgi:hypothetical protein
LNASPGGLDDDPAALAVAEQSDREPARALGCERGERRDEIVGLPGYSGVQPAPSRAADSALVE